MDRVADSGASSDANEALNGLRREIERVRATNILGNSESVLRLFDFLAESSLAGRSPKEAEVAVQVFGRRPDFPTEDAVVRVAVHRLRKRLATRHPDLMQPVRLNIPRGEYRFSLLDAPEQAVETKPKTLSRRHMIGLVGACTTTGAAAAVSTWWALDRAAPSRVDRTVRRNPIWAQLLDNNRPTLLVMGDYYIFGETTEDGASRLVREYEVNSPGDLDTFLMNHPGRMATYMDLGLTYLPAGDAQALANIAPLLRTARGEVQVVMSSKLTPQMIKDNNVVYIGYLSGLGLLKETAFAGSRFTIGDTYDELFDSRTQHKYVSQGGGPQLPGIMYRDYGYFSTFVGPAGNRFLIIAGTRDAGLMQMAEIATSNASLDHIHRTGGKGRAVEALYLIDGLDQLNVDGRLIVAAPLNEASIWNFNGKGRPTFPAG